MYFTNSTNNSLSRCDNCNNKVKYHFYDGINHDLCVECHIYLLKDYTKKNKQINK